MSAPTNDALPPNGCTSLTDISPLRDCPALQDLTIPRQARDIEFLRNKPGLRQLGYGKLLPAAEFWAEYDAQQAAGKKGARLAGRVCLCYRFANESTHPRTPSCNTFPALCHPHGRWE